MHEPLISLAGCHARGATKRLILNCLGVCLVLNCRLWVGRDLICSKLAFQGVEGRERSVDDVLVGQQDVSGTDGLVTAFVQVSDAAESPAASGSCICNLYHVADAREPNGSRVLPVQSCSLLFPQSS